MSKSASGNGSLGLSIGEVSRVVGVSPQTLRLWESESLIKPLRSKGGTRYYREEDIERLRQIRLLRSRHGMNLAAIRREIGFVDTVDSDDDTGKQQLSRKVGERLRQLRIRYRKTLREVAEATGLSVSFLSTLERGDTGASIASFRAIADVYGISLREVFNSGVKEGSRLVRPANRSVMRWPNGVRFEELAASGSLMNPSAVYVPPNAGSGGLYSHKGEEFIYVVSGTLLVQLKGEGQHMLATEDTLYFPSTIPHRWWTEDEGAHLIYVNTPPTF